MKQERAVTVVIIPPPDAVPVEALEADTRLIGKRVECVTRGAASWDIATDGVLESVLDRTAEFVSTRKESGCCAGTSVGIGQRRSRDRRLVKPVRELELIEGRAESEVYVVAEKRKIR